MTRVQGVEEEARPFLSDTAEEQPTEFLFNVDMMARMDELGLLNRGGERVDLRRGRLIYGGEGGGQPFRITVEMLRRMHEAGMFSGRRKHTYLLGGKLYTMAPIGVSHMQGQSKLIVALTNLVQGLGLAEALVVGSGTLILSEEDAPEPDAMVVQATTSAYFAASDARLVCEAAWSSLAEDLGPTKTLYARAGIPEYWVLDLQQRLLIVFRDPVDEDFRFEQKLTADETVSPLLAAGRGAIAVSDLLP